MKIFLKTLIQVVALYIAFRIGIYYSVYQSVLAGIPSKSAFVEETKNIKFLEFSVTEDFWESGCKSLRISDQSKIKEFFALIDFDEDQLPKPIFFTTKWSFKDNTCVCEGEFMAITDHAWFSFHHMKQLRWLKGPWVLDAPLTEESSIKIIQWLRKEGFTLIDRFETLEVVAPPAQSPPKSLKTQQSPYRAPSPQIHSP